MAYKERFLWAFFHGSINTVFDRFSANSANSANSASQDQVLWYYTQLAEIFTARQVAPAVAINRTCQQIADIIATPATVPPTNPPRPRMKTPIQCQSETRFVALMSELFQMDEAQALDFGIYRVIRRHNRDIKANFCDICSSLHP